VICVFCSCWDEKGIDPEKKLGEGGKERKKGRNGEKKKKKYGEERDLQRSSGPAARPPGSSLTRQQRCNQQPGSNESTRVTALILTHGASPFAASVSRTLFEIKDGREGEQEQLRPVPHASD